MRHLQISLVTASLLATAFWALPVAAQEPEVVATVDGRAITQAELEAHVSHQLKQLDQQRRQILESGLGSLVEMKLIERAATDSGQNTQAFLEAEVMSKVSVSQADVDAFYEANKARLGGQPKDKVADRLRAYLEQQAAQERRAEVVRDLRKKFTVSIALEPWRVDLGSSTDVPSRGSEEAPVTLTVFSDFQCPGCRSVEPLLDEVRSAYGDRLQLEFRQFPLVSIHPQAFKAAEAALCAGDQGKFWDMHASLFEDQRRLDRAALGERAKELELELATFDACLDGGEKKAIVDRDMRLGREIGVTGTPTLYVNGRPIQLSSKESLTTVIDDELTRQGG